MTEREQRERIAALAESGEQIAEAFRLFDAALREASGKLADAIHGFKLGASALSKEVARHEERKIVPIEKKRQGRRVS